ncbi:MAG: DNA polymerase III subunit gamma/tau [Bacteroidales bacterium]|nr:DNA polymerase III subunit gamma/tau [Bacteroidales bacterium]
MENFIVSARKYRPATFATVIGQESITRTLKNSIESGHLGQAYLFCGPRGVGKTTCARIFAKTINCQNLSPELEACNECESCKSFNTSASFNVVELDAASNNSVDDIRQLIDQVRIPPQIGKYSVYIIDEVHMLSTQAFNAFLKTLEEPPRHAIFILATTEKHKILPTILSRCQIFDFNRIKVDDIVNHLANVAEKEGVTIDKEALNVIATKASGGLRDALSIFDQIVSFSGKNVTYQNTIENLNVLDYEYFFKLTDLFLKSDYASALVTFDEILNKGFDDRNFLQGLCSHFRDLLVSKDPKTIPLLEVSESTKERYANQSKNCPIEFLFTALDLAQRFDEKYKESNNKRLHVELALLQFCNILKKKLN